MGTLHDRVGEEENLRRNPSLNDRESTPGVWTRVFGWSGDREGRHTGVANEFTPEFDYDLYGLQAGVDIWRHTNDKGVRQHAGATLAYGRATADATHYDGRNAGEDEIDVYTLGGYYTRFDSTGAYIDAVGQYSLYEGVARSPRLPKLSGSATALAVSLEVGKPIDLKKDQAVTERGWILEPQGQLIWQNFQGQDANDIAARIRFEETNSLVGRLGLRAANTWERETELGKRYDTLWGRINVWHEFLDSPKTIFSSEDGPVEFESDIEGTWLDVNAGWTRQISTSATFYADVGYIWDTEDKGSAVHGRIGMRWNW